MMYSINFSEVTIQFSSYFLFYAYLLYAVNIKLPAPLPAPILSKFLSMPSIYKTRKNAALFPMLTGTPQAAGKYG